MDIRSFDADQIKYPNIFPYLSAQKPQNKKEWTTKLQRHRCILHILLHDVTNLSEETTCSMIYLCWNSRKGKIMVRRGGAQDEAQEGHECRSICPHGVWGKTPSLCLVVFRNSLTTSCTDIYGDLIFYAWWILIHIPASFPMLDEELKVARLYSGIGFPHNHPQSWCFSRDLIRVLIRVKTFLTPQTFYKI